MSTIHRSKYGTYHPAENQDVAWTVNDTRGYIDGGPACDECGACECERYCESNANGQILDACESHPPVCQVDESAECIGLSFAYICLDGGDTLCRDCFDKQTDVKVVDCDCA